MWQAAFSSNNVLKKRKPPFENGQERRTHRPLAQAARALVAVEHLVQNVLAALCLRFDNASAFKADRDVVDERALIGERLGVTHMAITPKLMGGGEPLLGRDVRIPGDSVLRRRRPALPVMTVGEPDREIRARSG